MKKLSNFLFETKKSIEIFSFENSNFLSPKDLWEFASSFDCNFFIIKFFATWCFPCKKIDRTLSLVKTFSKTFLIQIDVDKMPTFAKSNLFNIKTVPTLFIFKEGKLLLKLEESSITKEELELILTV